MYIFIGIFVVNMSTKKIWGLIILFTFIFPLLFILIPYDNGWDWENLKYVDFWSVKGFIRNTFYNGFHPVFPWVSFLFLGILFGRLDFDRSTLKKILIISILIAVESEVASYYLVQKFPEPLSYFFSRDAMPPSPLFVIASSAEAFIMIITSIFISDFLKNKFIVKPLVYTGQMVLSHYVFHVFIGMGFLEVIGRLSGQTLEFSVLFASIYFIMSVIFSYFWCKKFKRGPLELLMRKISG